MTTRHTISHADTLYAGDAAYGGYSPDGRRGIVFSHQLVEQYGAVAAADTDGLCVNLTATAAVANFMTTLATGVLVSSSVGTFTTPRCASITSTGNLSSVNFTFTGTDQYGEAVTETVAGPNNTTVYGLKALKTVTGIASDAAATAFNIGSGTKIGFPVRVGDAGAVLGVYVDGVPETTLTVVAGLAATGVSTATTADVRGTFTPNTAPNGSKYFTTVISVPDHSTKEAGFGASQA